jgi:ATP-dependent RNA helicase DeaD
MDKPAEITRFDQLDLSTLTLRALKRCDYVKPSPVQAALIPLALEGYDVIGQARTGTGKTAAFALPILDQLDPLTENPLPQALILTPTRELADQVAEEMRKLAWGVPTQITVLCGGKNMRGQLKELEQGTQIIVGTPGRVHDHMMRRSLRTHGFWCVVLDEADRMLDIGFLPQIQKILRHCPEDRQTLLLSATMPAPIQVLAQRYMHEPKVIDCCSNQMSVDTIEQHYFTVDADRKVDLILRLLQRENPKQAIVFCRTKRGVDKLQLTLSKHFQKVGCMHGDMQQSARDRVMKKVRAEELQILVATDVVGRGIDVSTISHIINYDVPQDRDDYVHRVGRTGRMGREGVAYTFISPGEGEFLTAIEHRINKLLIADTIEGFDACPTFTTRTTAAAVAAEAPVVVPTAKRLNPTNRRSTRRR